MDDRHQSEALGSRELHLHPLDVGFDLHATGHRIVIARSDDPVRVSYQTRRGERRVLEGPQKDILRTLRRLGFRFRLE